MNETIAPKPAISKRMPIISLVLVVVALISMGAAWYYANQAQLKTAALSTAHEEKSNNAKTITDLNAKIANLEKTAPSLVSQATYYDIPELGIKIKLDASIKDLVYAYDQKLKVAVFYTRSTAYKAAVDNKMDGYKIAEGSLGSVSVINTITDCVASCPTELKDLGNGYHVMYTHVQSVASQNSTTQSLIEKSTTSLETALKSATPL